MSHKVKGITFENKKASERERTGWQVLEAMRQVAAVTAKRNVIFIKRSEKCYVYISLRTH